MKENKNDALTQALLLEQLKYDPDTGAFVWLRGPRKGRIAGCINKHRKSHVIRVNNVLHYAHRLAYLYMLGEWPTDDIDHANGISSDNRWANLRPATRSQNLANKGKSSFNTSGFKGVSFCKTTDRWRAQIEVRGTPVHIGRYDTPEEAHAAYIEAAREYFGEFARAA